MYTYTVKKSRDEFFPWAVVDQDDFAIAKFAFDYDAELVAKFLNAKSDSEVEE